MGRARRQQLAKWGDHAFLEQVREMECNNWLSTDPDSVDGLPSCHLSLVSAGRQPIFSTDASEEPSGFHLGVKKLLDLVQPQINGILLPEIRGLLNSTSIAISDIFIRRYGQNM